MYENIRKQICKNITEMDDDALLHYIAHLAVADVKVLDKFIDFDVLKAYAESLEEDLKDGGEDVK